MSNLDIAAVADALKKILTPRAVSASEFRLMSHAERNEHVRHGGRIIPEPDAGNPERGLFEGLRVKSAVFNSWPPERRGPFVRGGGRVIG